MPGLRLSWPLGSGSAAIVAVAMVVMAAANGYALGVRGVWAEALLSAGIPVGTLVTWWRTRGHSADVRAAVDGLMIWTVLAYLLLVRLLWP